MSRDSAPSLQYIRQSSRSPRTKQIDERWPRDRFRCDRTRLQSSATAPRLREKVESGWQLTRDLARETASVYRYLMLAQSRAMSPVSAMKPGRAPCTCLPPRFKQLSHRTGSRTHARARESRSCTAGASGIIGESRSDRRILWRETGEGSSRFRDGDQDRGGRGERVDESRESAFNPVPLLDSANVPGE